jgi:predicted transcriptional regulator
MRLACIYALLDCSSVVRAEHLMAALEVWRYCEDSARFVFGDALGDTTADEIIRELRQAPAGLTRNEIREHFNRNKSSAEIGRALGVLLEYGLARVERCQEDESQKRRTERWFAVYAVRD